MKPGRKNIVLKGGAQIGKTETARRMVRDYLRHNPTATVVEVSTAGVRVERAVEGERVDDKDPS